MVKKIAIVFGGPSSEHEVSLNSASTIYHFINKNKYEIYFFFISKENKCKLLIADPATNIKNIKATTPLIDGLKEISDKKLFALLAGIHGEFVEDGKLQNLLDFFQISYSGSSSKASSLCMNKYHSMIIAKEINGLLTPKTFYTTSSYFKNIISYPCIVKPNSLGSSVGLYKAASKEEIEKDIKNIHKNLGVKDVLVQEFIEGYELSCGCLQKKDGSFLELPPIEIRPLKSSTFDYKSKYEINGSEEITPPVSISKNLSKKISLLTTQLHSLLGCSLYSRSDFRVKGNDIYYLETNTLPGMTATSLLPQEAKAAGISFSGLLDFIIDNS